MTDAQLDDFKQFLDSRLSLLEGHIVSAFDSKLNIKVDELRREMSAGFVGVGEAIDDILNYVDGNFIRKPSWLRTKT